ncbi:MAG: hypothetical protein JNM41_07635 [Flavipsychrobacter sp.]|nr:hypothetical protein [Flavipsychrobacter sp.]
MKLGFFVVLFIGLSLFACRKQNRDPVTRVVFGTYYKTCTGDCVKLYCLDETTLSSDELITDLAGKWIEYSATRILSDAKRNEVAELLNNVPGELLKNDNRTFGCPDCAGQGGMYIETQVESREKYHIDLTNTADQSPDVVAYKQRVLEAIKKIQ